MDKILNLKTHTQNGNIGFGYSIAYYASKGYIVSIPLNDSQKYDLVYDDGNSLNKIQVKTTRQKLKSGNFTVGLRTISGNKVLGFDYESFDFLLILTDDKELYEIPSIILKNYKNSITLGEKFQKYRVML